SQLLCVHYAQPSAVTFFLPDPPTTEIYTLSLHDALPIWRVPTPNSPATAGGRPKRQPADAFLGDERELEARVHLHGTTTDKARRSEDTRLNSSHVSISYAVFCLKKKKKQIFCKIFIWRR